MTKTTNTRQLRETIGAALQANGIDNLKAEADVCSAVTRFLEEVKTGRDPVKVREEIANSMMDGIVQSQPYEKMKQRIMGALNLNISEHPDWPRVIRYCLERDAADEPIEKFATACSENPYGMPKPFQIAQKPQIIIDVWPQAFAAKVEKHEPIYQKFVAPDDSQAVPNPFSPPHLPRRGRTLREG